MLEDIDAIIYKFNCKHLLIGGDYNTVLSKDCHRARMLKVFFAKHDVKILQNSSAEKSTHTFCNSQGHCSLIDYIGVSSHITKYVSEYGPTDSAINLSDHIPLLAVFTYTSCNDIFSELHNYNVSHSNKQNNEFSNKRLRWDHGNTVGYYEFCRDNLYYIYNDILLQYDYIMHCLSNKLNTINMQILIDFWYDSIISVLKSASDIFIPQANDSYYKHWWNDDLNCAKNKSIDSYNIWVSAGRPKTGAIFNLKTRDKLSYKFAIRQNKTKADAGLSEELCAGLQTKDGKAFWKTWNNKVCNSKNKKIILENNIDDKEATNKFANLFKSATNANSMGFHKDQYNEFIDKLNRYNIDELGTQSTGVTAESINNAFLKLTTGKSPGFDGIVYEHISHCHPVVYSMLAKLFNIMIAAGIVPRAFGMGIVIPIPKESSNVGTHKIENFRGITLSPIISKIVFYICMHTFYVPVIISLRINLN